MLDKSPRELAEQRLKEASFYAKLGQRKVELIQKRALYYKLFRKDHKSDASLERSWELTKDGIEYLIIKEKMKSKEFKMSALRTLLEVRENEVRNQY